MKLYPGLKKEDISKLEQDIPVKDKTAERLGKPVHHGRIEDIENALVPWLRDRRRSRRLID